MSSLTFKALIDGVHFDPKKGAVKISLIATSHVSMDKLTSLGPADESVRIILESAQTKITDVGDAIALSPEAKEAPEEGENWLEKAADELRGKDAVEGVEEEPLDQVEADEDEDRIATEFPLSDADGDKDEVEEGEGI